MDWVTIKRPGFFGRNRDWMVHEFDERYGSGNWRLAWSWQGNYLPPHRESGTHAYGVYEDAYFDHSLVNRRVWQRLLDVAQDVYDTGPTDVISGSDYTIQTGHSTHLQDIAIRRVVKRQGWEFRGRELISIRSPATEWGNIFSPGRVRFHYPREIETPQLEGWWDPDTVEAWYQSNKHLQITQETVTRLRDEERAADDLSRMDPEEPLQ